MPAAALVARSADLWSAATRHPFLDAVREGTLPPRAFDTWLAQDARFVADLLAFQARLLARAPRAAQAVLVGGAAALVDELTWFEGLAARRGLDLDATPLPATEAYAALLDRLDGAPYPVAVTALWALERVYLEAWGHAAPGDADTREAVAHWTAPGFDAYVAGLEALADDAVAELPQEEMDRVFGEVLGQERDFWQMALDPGHRS